MGTINDEARRAAAMARGATAMGETARGAAAIGEVQWERCNGRGAMGEVARGAAARGEVAWEVVAMGMAARGVGEVARGV